jgi:hypothetical protein
MEEFRFKLFFKFNSKKCELVKTEYNCLTNRRIITCVRGQQERVGFFQWRRGVQALALLLLKSKRASFDGIEPALIEGGRKSLAASLGYSIAKNSTWSNNMFGSDFGGRSYIRTVLRYSNLEPRGDVPVVFRVNQNVLSSLQIGIFVNSDLIQCPIMLNRMIEIIESKKEDIPLATSIYSLNSIDLLLQENIDSLDFSSEWLRIVGQVVLDTKVKLRATCFDKELSTWWRTFAGRVYFNQNYQAILNGTKILRFFVADPDNSVVFNEVLRHALAHRSIGVDSRVELLENFHPWLDGDFVSIHDSRFVACHVPEDKSELIVKRGLVEEATDYFDAIFNGNAIV